VFEQFLEQLSPGGTAVLWNELSLGVTEAHRRVTYGVEAEAMLVARAVAASGLETSFALERDGRHVCSVTLRMPGTHNVLDALAALAACEAAGIDLARAAAALAGFRAARRRFEARGERSGARIFDDYAHHPTEVDATLAAARALRPERLIAAFQPHLYSRTLHLHREFGRALAQADEVVVLDVYPARERPAGELAGVTGRLVADAVADHAPGRAVWWLPTIEEAATVLARRLGPGDVLVTLGAGDVDRLASLLVDGGNETRDDDAGSASAASLALDAS
jgi:UDP-N-acetylmuramate--alanine ligase